GAPAGLSSTGTASSAGVACWLSSGMGSSTAGTLAGLSSTGTGCPSGWGLFFWSSVIFLTPFGFLPLLLFRLGSFFLLGLGAVGRVFQFKRAGVLQLGRLLGLGDGELEPAELHHRRADGDVPAVQL